MKPPPHRLSIHDSLSRGTVGMWRAMQSKLQLDEGPPGLALTSGKQYGLVPDCSDVHVSKYQLAMLARAAKLRGACAFVLSLTDAPGLPGLPSKAVQLCILEVFLRREVQPAASPGGRANPPRTAPQVAEMGRIASAARSIIAQLKLPLELPDLPQQPARHATASYPVMPTSESLLLVLARFQGLCAWNPIHVSFPQHYVAFPFSSSCPESSPESPADGARAAGGADGTAQPPPVLQEGELPSSGPSAQNQPLVYRKPGTGGERIMALDVLERHFSFRCAPFITLHNTWAAPALSTIQLARGSGGDDAVERWLFAF